jgi:TfoX/Sxy family transcriptional regulator of competence genes
MSYDERLAQRIRKILLAEKKVSEKKMFGGLAFMLNGSMFCGIIGDDLMVRVGPENYEAVLERPHARPMDFTGRPMKGYVYVAPAGCDSQRALEQWVHQGMEFASTLPPKPSKKLKLRKR